MFDIHWIQKIEHFLASPNLLVVAPKTPVVAPNKFDIPVIFSVKLLPSF
jgi:hypothetical protein